MAKRVSIARRQIPTIDVRNLRDPSETSLKAFGLGVPLVAYGTLLGVGFATIDSLGKPIVINFGSYLLLGLFGLVVMGKSRKSRMLKKYPRSKVAGTAWPEIRMMLSRLCRLLDMKQIPECYIIDSNAARATVRGGAGNYLVISSRLVNSLSSQELEAIICTLLGQIKAGNMPFRNFVTTLQEANGLWKVLCLPYQVAAWLMANYVEASYNSGDRLAMLLLDADYMLLTRAVIKVVGMGSDAITPEQLGKLDAFLSKQGVDASAEDVEHQYLLGLMTRTVPGLKSRLHNIHTCSEDPRFQEELAKMRQRQELLHPGERG